ncbi:MAG TPA: hypothetical protein VFU21_20690, partial [Kofleriaceae bacterium]|nr:hypothetical protein [Kofleriaceae bacterium]
MSWLRDRALICLVGLSLTAGCGDDDATSGDGAPADGGALLDAAVSDGGGARACDEAEASAPPGPRAAIEVVRPGARLSDIYLVDLSGPFPICPVRVTPESLADGSGIVAGWSPDATMLAYAGGGAVQVVDARGDRPAAPVRVTPEGATSCCALEWSPDSRWIGFAAVDAEGQGDSYVSQVVDGAVGDAIDIVPGMATSVPAWRPGGGGMLVRDLGAGSPLPLYWIPMNATGPGSAELVTDQASTARWSPAGDRLVYSVMSDGRTELYVVDLDGDALGVARLVTTHAGSGHVFDNYHWSPDGTRLLYLVAGSPSRLFTVDVTAPTPTARRVDDPDLGPVSHLALGWVSAERIHYQGGGNVLYLVDLADGNPGPSRDPSGGLETNAIAPDHRSMIAETIVDEQYLAPVWVSLAPGGPPPRPFDGTTPNFGYWYSFTGDSQRVLYAVQLPTQLGERRRYRLHVFDPTDPAAEPVFLLETHLESAIPRMGPETSFLLWEDEPDRPAVLYHGDLAAAADLEVV